MIHLAVDYCKCHMKPADQCSEVIDMLLRGVPPGDLTYEVIIPPFVNEMRKSGSKELQQALDIVLDGYLPGGAKEASVS